MDEDDDNVKKAGGEEESSTPSCAEELREVSSWRITVFSPALGCSFRACVRFGSLVALSRDQSSLPRRPRNPLYFIYSNGEAFPSGSCFQYAYTSCSIDKPP